MEENETIQAIVKGMELYFRSFALADNMDHHTGDLEWIAPLPGASGPAIVFRVALDQQTVMDRIAEIIAAIRAGGIPSFWVISPTSTPANVLELLLSRGFTGGADPAHPEPGMALDLEDLPSLPANESLEVIKVQTSEEFAAWIDVVNEALHGWPLLTHVHYCSWLSRDELSFYLGLLNGIPIATVATIQAGGEASLEFVSTLKNYRRQGAALAVCLAALRALQQGGVKTVTLRSSTEAIPLYRKLGFQSYYEQVLISLSGPF